jgi:DNA-binding YbaB/EbfC family protein
MFKELGQIANLIRQGPRIREEMEKLQKRLGELIAEGDAGAGMVKVRANGRMEILQCQISQEALALDDRELLEDLIRGATNQALEKVRNLVAEETTKAASGFGLGGMDLSGMMGGGNNP